GWVRSTAGAYLRVLMRVMGGFAVGGVTGQPEAAQARRQPSRKGNAVEGGWVRAAGRTHRQARQATGGPRPRCRGGRLSVRDGAGATRAAPAASGRAATTGSGRQGSSHSHGPQRGRQLRQSAAGGLARTWPER